MENQVHYVRDVTQGEDASRIRTTPLVQIWAIARNLDLNLYRSNGFENMALWPTGNGRFARAGNTSRLSFTVDITLINQRQESTE